MMHPTICVSGAATGLMTWFNSVVPSLFPFMVLTGLLTRTGALNLLNKKCKTLKGLNRLPITGIFAVLTGILCGYPMGIKTVSELKCARQLSDEGARYLYTFVNQPGPMFILGYALPLTGVKETVAAAWLASFYGAVLMTAVTSYLFFRIKFFFGGGKNTLDHRQENVAVAHKQLSANSNDAVKDVSLIRLMEETLAASAETLTKIGGYMIIFSVIAALLGELIPDYPLIRLIFCGLLEMTSGAALAKDVGPLSPYLILFFISFGGLSVTAQSFTLGNLTSKNQMSYLFWKFFQAILSMTLYMLFIRFV